MLIAAAESCAHKPTKPVTLTILDTLWLNKEYTEWRALETQRFTRETGIGVRFLPAPETAVDQLTLWRRLLQEHSSSPDVYAIDVIWPSILGEYLEDLKPHLAREASKVFPQLIANDTVRGRLVAMPDRVGTGLLFYRSDLLAEYGFAGPPTTWDELETMAARIQAGERAKGQKDFWGFVWEGAPSEALTCNALEWQVSEGGGQIVENDGTISVNNAAAIRAWERAANWVGSISPPGVVDYLEWDAVNVWLEGRAAFMRNWPAGYVVSEVNGSKIKGKFDISILPRGRARSAVTFGGTSYSISRYSQNIQEALRLVQFLSRRDIQLWRAQVLGEPPVIPSLYQELKTNHYFTIFEQVFLQGATARPSNATGSEYADVSRAYFETVHSVLSGKKPAEKAAAELESRLVQITGFKTACCGATR